MVSQSFLLIDILHIQSQDQNKQTNKNPKKQTTPQNKTKNHQTKKPAACKDGTALTSWVLKRKTLHVNHSALRYF